MFKDKIKELSQEKLRQKDDFIRASKAGIAREIALNNGGTGELRKSISVKEANRIKARRKQAKKSRRQNRGS